MRHACLFLVALSLFSRTTVCQNTPDAASKDIQSLSDGFYYKTRQSWQKLEPLAMADSSIWARCLSPGSLRKWSGHFANAESPVRITDKRPTFYISLPQLADIAGRTYIALLIYCYFQPRFGVFGCLTNPATRRVRSRCEYWLGWLAWCLAAGSNSPANATNRARFMGTKVENTVSARSKKVASLTKPGINYAY
jgi:hypothetical protein